MVVGISDDRILFTLNVIRTIITDSSQNAIKFINKETKYESNMDHTIQFAVYVIETYKNTQAQQLCIDILNALNIDLNKAFKDFGTTSPQQYLSNTTPSTTTNVTMIQLAKTPINDDIIRYTPDPNLCNDIAPSASIFDEFIR